MNPLREHLERILPIAWRAPVTIAEQAHIAAAQSALSSPEEGAWYPTWEQIDAAVPGLMTKTAAMAVAKFTADLVRERDGAPAADAVLPCDVRVAPATTIRAGCPLSTLLSCIELRRQSGETFRFTRKIDAQDLPPPTTEAKPDSGQVVLSPVARDEAYDRDYIPLPGGWEVQTKGKGSTFRICSPNGDRTAIADERVHDVLRQMALDIRAAYEAHPPAEQGFGECVQWQHSFSYDGIGWSEWENLTHEQAKIEAMKTNSRFRQLVVRQPIPAEAVESIKYCAEATLALGESAQCSKHAEIAMSWLRSVGGVA